jgi:hypothetical protein
MARRTLTEIATEIRRDWTNPYFGAVPYIDAMAYLTGPADMFGQDRAEDIVRYFLENSRTWRGETARRVKAELKAMINN